MNDVALSTNYLVIPVTTSPAQLVNVTLGGQSCQLNIYTKSINVPVHDAGSIIVDPPNYQNINPVFIDVSVQNTLIVGGVLLLNRTLVVRNVYFGFLGDIAIIDTQGDEDPYGVPATLPQADLRNWWQRNLPLSLGGKSPPNIAGTIPGFGTRFILTYWPTLA